MENDLLTFAIKFRPGKWVRFVHDSFINVHNIIVKGMIGIVVQDPYGIAVTGIDVMVLPVGAKEPYGHLIKIMEILETEPVPQEIEDANKLWQNALDIYIQNKGWCGFVKVGKNIMNQERVLSELKDQSQKLLTFVATEGREKDAIGTKKRIATILKAFARHSLGNIALSLHENIITCQLNTDELELVLNKINNWIQRALTIERSQTSNEKQNKAWQDGNAIKEFFPLS